MLPGDAAFLGKMAAGTGGTLAEQAAHNEISEEDGAYHQQAQHDPSRNAHGFSQVRKNLQDGAGDFRKIRIHSLFSNKLL
jgi:hypothetical protein